MGIKDFGELKYHHPYNKMIYYKDTYNENYYLKKKVSYESVYHNNFEYLSCTSICFIITFLKLFFLNLKQCWVENFAIPFWFLKIIIIIILDEISLKLFF